MKKCYVFIDKTININTIIKSKEIEKSRKVFLDDLLEYSSNINKIKKFTINELLNMLDNTIIESYKIENEKNIEIIIKIYSKSTIEYDKYNRESFEYIDKEECPLFSGIFKLCLDFDEDIYTLKRIKSLTIEELGSFIEDEEFKVERLYRKGIEKQYEYSILKIINKKDIECISFNKKTIKLVLKLKEKDISEYILNINKSILQNLFINKSIDIKIEKETQKQRVNIKSIIN